MPEARTREPRELFARYASPGSVAVGVVMGLLYTALEHSPYGGQTDARAMLAVLFLTAGPMGFSYFWGAAKGRQMVPFIVEVLLFFFALWTVIGLVWVLRIFAYEPSDEVTILSLIVGFLVGAIAGTVWTMALLLFIGRRLDIAAWEVLRFPVWVARSLLWAYGTLRRR